jgi:hypothetical protein
MPRSEDGREAIDRAFAEIVAGYHLTAERPDPPVSGPLAAESRPDARAADSRSADALNADSRGSEQQGADVLSADPPPRTSEQHSPDPRSADAIVARAQETAPQQAAPIEPRVDDLPEQPLFRFVPYVPPAVDPATADRALPHRAAAESTPEPERFVPPPLEPLPRPDLPSLLGWIGIGLAVLFVLITAVGLRLPAWAGWLAIVGFVGALAVLIARLPRQRPPGDGAVL